MSAAAMTVLEPLAARYAQWLGLPVAAVDGRSWDEDPDAVRAMQLVLRVERAAPPGRTALLEAAASAAIAVCLDPRSAEGGEWHEDVAAWVVGRIRKVSRRARGGHWNAVQHLPGLTVTNDGGGAADGTAKAEPAGASDAAPEEGTDGPAQGAAEAEPAEGAGGAAEVRALVPGLVAELPREVGRLQVGGTDLPPDDPGPPPPGLPVLWLNPSVPMTVGKAAAQVGHATMIAAALLEATGEHAALAGWAANGYRVAVRTAPLRAWRNLHPGDDPLAAWRRRRVVAVRDAGFTEVAPGTVTVLAQAPREWR